MRKEAFMLIAVSLAVMIVNVYSIVGFSEFKAMQSKSYASVAEETKRQAVFNTNVKRIQALNDEAKKNNHSVVFGVTRFSDLEPKEFIAKFGGYKRDNKIQRSAVLNADSTSVAVSAVGDTNVFDWTTKAGIVMPIKDQGSCGSCWAFGAISALESFNALKTGSLVSLSEQQVNSCDKSNGGCNGGDHLAALRYLSQTGVTKGTDYKYTSGTSGVTGSCKISSYQLFLKKSYFTSIYQTKDETAMLSLLQKYGPMAVAMDATVLQSYKSGVIQKCSTSLNHVITLVGYGTDSSNIPYWKLRNQWGATWGEKGYFRLIRNKNICGIAREVYFIA